MNQDEMLNIIVQTTLKLSVEKHCHDTRLLRASTLFALGRLVEAEKDIEFLLSCAEDMDDEKLAECYRLRGGVRFKSGDKVGAAEDVKRAMQLSPKMAEELTGKFTNK